jgi:hypothetical protein
VNIVDLVKVLREYYSAALANGFKPAEAMELTKAYQQNMMQNDLMERLAKGNQPWEPT